MAKSTIHNRSGSFARVAVGMMVFEILIKLIGFVKQSVIAYYFGGTASMDIYFLSSDFINGLSNAVINSARIAVIAVFTSVRHEKGEEYGNSLLNQTAELTTLFAVLISLAIFGLAGPISSILAPGYTAPEHETLTHYIRIFSGIVVLSALCMIYESLLNSHERFLVTKTRSLIYSLVLILCCVFLSPLIGERSMVIAQYGAFVVYLIVQAVYSRKIFSFHFERITQRENLKQILFKMGPAMIGNSMVYINYQIDNTIASSLDKGSISALSYSHTIDDLFVGVMITSLATILFPHMANLIASGKEREGIDTLNKSLMTMLVALIPVSVVAFILSRDIVEVVYFRGKFESTVAALTATVFCGYAVRYPLVCIRDLGVQGLYAYKDTRKPMINSLIAAVVNIIASYVFSRVWGIIGISIGTTVAVALSAVLNMRALKGYTHENLFRDNGVSILKCLVSAAVAFFAAWMLFNALGSLWQVARLILTALATVIVYVSLNLLLRERVTVEYVKKMLSVLPIRNHKE